MAQKDLTPRGDRKMQQRLARGEAAALGELYDRFASLVHSLAHRVLGDEQAADAVTREVFAHVWEHPETYDPRQGQLRSWIAAVTNRLAVRRLRATETAALLGNAYDPADGGTPAHGTGDRYDTDPYDSGYGAATVPYDSGPHGADAPETLERKVRRASVAARADYIVHSMPTPLREALELAYFQRRDYRQTAAELGVTEDEARRRLRLGLQLLSSAHDFGTWQGYGGAV
ncbi:sigma-70 family RNA polymerase sigma factor [Streptomyces sp. J2-1]|uniref:sigma-70 family RNA polymerase sigma factor n=1 Tax=Streptomyces corallincola TaxID=2851888 RepID=UPI001C3868C8|nr:sigma-70 family RNA polymerase sigma factor [Streptomyces corallincola]MBV2357751.1 sigma-70 family RNA polymerase sigma factor [Streptomyces corallincola]